MMTRTRLTAAAAFLVAATLLPINCFATTAVPFNGVGSSAGFNAFALAAYQATQCGTNIWTKKSTAQAIDSRSPSIPAETGNIWLIWATDGSGNVTKICSYLQVDSVVGNRMFFAAPRGTLSIPSSNVGVAGDDLVPTLTDTTLTQNAYNAINGQVFNCAPTDIRAEDALFATTRALTPYDGGFNGLGYGPGPIGTAIVSAFSSKSAQVINFAISGTDPITGQTIGPWGTLNVGAQVGIVFVNTNDTSSAGFGNSAFANINRFVLANVLNGTFTRTRDVLNQQNLPSVGAHVLLREPMSGTMNTVEFSITRSKEINSSQEAGVNPASGGNPLNISYVSGGTRQRVIGTGEMTSEVSAITDSIGYAFWSTGNFAKVVGNTKYLMVDGVDPLYTSYAGGFFPTCVAPCPGLVQFTNVLNGTYPIWNILRVVTSNPVPSGVSGLVAAAQTNVINVPDFVPYSQMQVFRSHYNQSGKTASNGHKKGVAESGGDVGGAVLTIQSDLDSVTDTGKELVGLKQ